MEWNPQQYDKFRSAREQPFDDLVALIKPATSLRIVDLGCGPGNLTRKLAERFTDADVVGLDSSMEMLATAKTLAGPRLRFVPAAIEAFADGGGVDGDF